MGTQQVGLWIQTRSERVGMAIQWAIHCVLQMWAEILCATPTDVNP